MIKRFIKRFFYALGINPHGFFSKSVDHEVEFALELLRPYKTGTMIDVGFAWGQSSLPFLLKGWKSYAFEPDKTTSKLRAIKNLAYHFPKLLVSREAISNDVAESVSFYTSDESEGIASLHAFKDHELSHEVKTTTLNSVVARNQIEEIHFLKIDVEGHDLSVLRSLDFAKIVPLVILVEFDDFKTKPLGYDYHSLGEFLIDRGYKVLMFEWSPIVEYGVEHTLKNIQPYPSELKDDRAWGNFFAYTASHSDAVNSILRSKYPHYL